MVCMYCAGPTAVVNSRAQRRANHIWRRRKCLACGSIFTTEERPQLAGSLAVQHPSGALQAFSRDQLFVSVHDSCKHRATALEDAAALTDTILNLLRPLIKNGCVNRADIVTTSHDVLRRFDHTAATVYAAYHPSN
jgi:transcriptional regulator NrdR family protein